MKYIYRLPILTLLILCSIITSKAQHPVSIRFNSQKEVSGRKLALHDLSPGLPTNWDGYNYLVLEMKITTPQRFQVGLTTNSGYNELRVMSYCANGW
ncbi:MAG: hypothetical protein LWW85_04270, partial [Marinilabiliales bacterium]|nr:hypothetical protein [Marinilabiliales bacterium]